MTTELDALAAAARTHHARGEYAAAAAAYLQIAELTELEESAAVDAFETIQELVALGPAELEPAPYRRYGLRPSTWHAADVIALRLTLATTPTAAAREEIEAVIEGVIDDSPEIAGDPVQWSGHFLIVTIAVDPDGDYPSEAFEALEAVADAIHESHGIGEAVGLNAIGVGDDDMGELWSIATQPIPNPGPPSPYDVAFWPIVAEDPAGLAPFAPLVAPT